MSTVGQRTRKVMIRTHSGADPTVDGECFDPWAITPTEGSGLREQGFRWTVTHIPTGTAAGVARLKKDARKAARWLRANCADGVFSEPHAEPIRKHLQKPENALPIRRALHKCRVIPVGTIGRLS